MQFTDPAAYRQWRDSCWAWYEWRATDARNALGMTPQMLIPVASVTAFLMVLHWPADNNPRTFAATFNPAGLAKTFDSIKVGQTFCEGPSYPDGNCNAVPKAKPTQPVPASKPNPWSPTAAPDPAPTRQPGRSPYDEGIPVTEMVPPNIIPRLMFCFALLVIFAPSKVRWLFGVVEAKPDYFSFTPETEKPSLAEYDAQAMTGPPLPLPPGGGFGRKRV
jgi:hypothetical protein